MRIDDHRRSSWLRLLFVFLLALALGACGGKAVTKEGENSSEEIRTLWKAGEQYVRLTSADEAVNNQHPVAITVEEIRTVLESLFVPERRFFQKKLNPVFSPGEVQVLSAALAQGLSEAKPNQDITFVTIGLHQGTFAKVRKANTGRVFFKEDKLNIIFGMLHHEVRDQDRQTGEQIDRRLRPFVVGSRSFEAELPITVALEEGQAFYLDPDSGEEREDWLMLDVPTIVAQAEDNETEGQMSPEASEDVARSNRETQNLKEDLVNVKEVVFELKEALQELQQKHKSATTIEDRLQSLKKLHEKELITADEYRAKRQELLDEL